MILIKMFAHKKIIITGGAGFLGNYVVKELIKNGVKKDNIFIPRKKHYDLRRSEDIRKMFNDFPSDIVIHLAASTGGIDFYRKHPGTLFYNNLIMGLELMEQARLNKIEKFVVIGSGVMYPPHAETPLKEESIWNGYPEGAAAAYGLYNRALLAQSQQYRKEFGFESIFLIPANLYGPNDYFEMKRSHIIPAMISKFYSAKKEGLSKVEVWGSGKAAREFLYVEDAARLIVLATKKYNSPEPLNLGHGTCTPIREIVKIISENVGYDGKIYWNTSMPEGVLKRCYDISKLNEFLGKQKYTSLEEGIDETIKEYEKTL